MIQSQVQPGNHFIGHTPLFELFADHIHLNFHLHIFERARNSSTKDIVLEYLGAILGPIVVRHLTISRMRLSNIKHFSCLFSFSLGRGNEMR